MSSERKAKERWAAHAATAKELAKIEKQLVRLNRNIEKLSKWLVDFIK
jgi:hypothetical protein